MSTMIGRAGWTRTSKTNKRKPGSKLSSEIPFPAGEGQFRERSDRDARGPLRHVRFRLFSPSGARDIDMRPRPPPGEFLEKERRGDRTCRPAAGVGEVRNLALELILVVV